MYLNFYGEQFVDTSLRLLNAMATAYLGPNTIYLVQHMDPSLDENNIQERLKSIRNNLRKIHPPVHPVTILDYDSINSLEKKEWEEYAMKGANNKIHSCNSSKEVMELYQLLEKLSYS